MRSGFAPQTAATPTAVVTGVAGADVLSVKTTREIGGGGIPGESSTAAASGSIEWAGPVTQDGPAPSPWKRAGNFPPQPGTKVTVSAGTVEYGVFSQLTGVIDDSSAGADGMVTSNIVDPVDLLHRKITIPARLSSMPPLEYDGPLRNVGMSSDYIADDILRRCAMFSTPYQLGSVSGVNVPGQGSVWPARGTCVTAGSKTDQALHAAFATSNWGWGITDCEATYLPDGNFTLAGGAEIDCMVASYHSATSDITAYVPGNPHFFRLAIYADRSIAAQYYNGSTTTTVASLPATPDYRRVVMRISAGSVWLGTDDNRVSTGSHTAPGAVTTANVSLVGVRVIRGGSIGGIIVGNQPANHYMNYPLNARLWAGTTLAPGMIATPRLENVDALEALTEIANSTCRAYWWDEDGMFQWMPGDYMMVRASSTTLTSKDNLIDLGWSESLSDTHSSVNVEYDDPVVARSRKPNVMVWQGQGDSMGSSEILEEIVTPGSDEEWIQPDMNPRNAWDAAWINEHNHGRGSVKGGVRTDGTNTWWASGLLTTDIELIGPNAWKFTYQTGGVASGQSVQRAFTNSEATSSYWQRWRGESLPIIRAYGKTSWAQNSITQGSGNGAAGVYSHTGGRWIQGFSRETPGRIANFLEDWLCKPRVKATAVEVVHDPRVQVGDVVTIRDEHAHGVELKVLITRVDQEVSAGEQSMTLDFFIIDGYPAWLTLGEHNSSQTSTMATHNTSQAGESLAEHDTDPRHLI